MTKYSGVQTGRFRCDRPNHSNIPKADSTPTGRLANSEPNMQIPSPRTEIGRELRAAFAQPIPPHLQADFSSIERRIMTQIDIETGEVDDAGPDD